MATRNNGVMAGWGLTGGASAVSEDGPSVQGLWGEG